MFLVGLAVMSIDFGSEFMKIAIVKVGIYTCVKLFICVSGVHFSRHSVVLF